ncbi:chorismate--pyruvate lyase family protein [Idiomarina seosinensis]|uniref:Probable chorismate pyruvate-lyase n=1 Tax=Idiomarina seosinensis TaxID=281739 RepID=A0A432ZDI3_9GAMM|nr:chorismate lyase [Idiomarina seosinensis]RUO76018.1 chorismate--pyruvate lyase [Idiomarina seosinensis]
MTIRFPLAQPSHWQRPEVTDLPAAAESWLLAEGSLTQKLKLHSQHFSVHVIGQQTAPVFESEFDMFRRHHKRVPFEAVVREVILSCDDTPWVFARSIFPLSAVNQKNLNLSNIGSTSLGQSLFDQTDLLRSPFEVSKLDINNSIAKLNKKLHEKSHPLWGRRSLFQTSGQQVLVSEVFLSPVPFYQELS